MNETNLAILIDRFVRRLHLDLQAKAMDFDTENIGPGGAMILLALSDLGEVPMHILAKNLTRDKSQMTRTVGPLERKGLLVRRQCEADARVINVDLTEKGEEIVETHRKVLTETIDELLAPLSNPDKAQLKHLLSQAFS